MNAEQTATRNIAAKSRPFRRCRFCRYSIVNFRRMAGAWTIFAAMSESAAVALGLSAQREWHRIVAATGTNTGVVFIGGSVRCSPWSNDAAIDSGLLLPFEQAESMRPLPFTLETGRGTFERGGGSIQALRWRSETLMRLLTAPAPFAHQFDQSRESHERFGVEPGIGFA